MFLLFCGDSLRDSLHYLDCRDTFYILYFYSYIQFFRGFNDVGSFVKNFVIFNFMKPAISVHTAMLNSPLNVLNSLIISPSRDVCQCL